ncbi:DNA-3-methyladenine glycosylase family protein [Rhodovulum sp. DZ06]|uniref:DNA-3-methyladenine glycosylase family protein n=1 Tax=Rhodovulum sp. DZ06 TaxID=3425126 RepID=UPI003D3563F7
MAAMTPPFRIIETEACIAEGMAHLRRVEPRFAAIEAAVQAAGLEIPLRRRPDGFAALLSAVVSQQISVAAAAGIWARLEAAGADDPARLLAMEEEALRGCGLSRPKVRYARALAAAGIDWDGLRAAPEEAVRAALTAVPGIGAWTAEIYLMFSLGRADVFAPGDLALQESARAAFGLPERPKPKDFARMAEAWAPWRAVAARALWAYYRVLKGREGLG